MMRQMPFMLSRSRSHSERGFTLIEAALATIIVGVGVVSTMQLFASCSIENAAAAKTSTASMLAGNIQEVMANQAFADPIVGHSHFGPETGEVLSTYNDVDDFDGSSFNPPIDALRQPITNMSQYTQVVSVWPVYPTKLSVNSNEASPDIPKTGAGPYTGAVRVRVKVTFRQVPSATPVEVYRTSWIRVDY